jgi:hypothetical protein
LVFVVFLGFCRLPFKALSFRDEMKYFQSEVYKESGTIGK